MWLSIVEFQKRNGVYSSSLCPFLLRTVVGFGIEGTTGPSSTHLEGFFVPYDSLVQYLFKRILHPL